MTATPGSPPVRLHADPLDLAVELPLSEDEATAVQLAGSPGGCSPVRSRNSSGA